MHENLRFSPLVEQTLAEGGPVVALESTVITHGLPYPQNVETALSMEAAVRSGGAVPATIAVIGGKVIVGINEDEVEYLGNWQEKERFANAAAAIFRSPSPVEKTARRRSPAL